MQNIFAFLISFLLLCHTLKPNTMKNFIRTHSKEEAYGYNNLNLFSNLITTSEYKWNRILIQRFWTIKATK